MITAYKKSAVSDGTKKQQRNESLYRKILHRKIIHRAGLEAAKRARIRLCCLTSWILSPSSSHMPKSWYVLTPILLVIAAIAAGAFLPHRTSVESTVATSSGGAVPPAASSSTLIRPKPITGAITGTVNGTVLLGPICPVEHIPPEPQCADKAYQTSIRIYEGNSAVLYRTISSSAQGAFSIQLAVGSYTFAPVGGEGMPPTCRPSKVSVAVGQTQNVQLDCDTGIR